MFACLCLLPALFGLFDLVAMFQRERIMDKSKCPPYICLSCGRALRDKFSPYNCKTYYRGVTGIFQAPPTSPDPTYSFLKHRWSVICQASDKRGVHLLWNDENLARALGNSCDRSCSSDRSWSRGRLLSTFFSSSMVLVPSPPAHASLPAL